jgi:hypothetical protein
MIIMAMMIMVVIITIITIIIKVEMVASYDKLDVEGVLLVCISDILSDEE